ncbi:arylformamidase [Leucobacter zeae]|nr:arylformamidase [Leucobacter zeae]
MNPQHSFAEKGIVVRLIDLSPPIGPSTPHWPGDQPFHRADRWSISSGDSVNVSTTTTTAHIGAHVDAPSHVREGGDTVERTPLDACIGRCLVVDVTDLVSRAGNPHRPAPAQSVRERLRGLAGDGRVERLILRHRSRAAGMWDSDTPGLDPDLVTWFGSQGGALIGIDLDSFDPERSIELPAHAAAVDAGIVMLEGLDLTEAPEGWGELFAPPIPWLGADASPARAVLRVAG